MDAIVAMRNFIHQMTSLSWSSIETSIASVRISASFIYEADVATSLSNPINDSTDRLSCTALWSNFRNFSNPSSKLFNGSSALVAAECWLAWLILAFLKHSIPCWHEILHHLDDGCLWKRLIFVQCFDT